MDREAVLRRRVRILLGITMAGLVLSGLTAFPIATELHWLTAVLGAAPDGKPEEYSGLLSWLVRVRNAVERTGAEYPFLAYGTDWLAFAHLVIAIAFIGPLRDPVRNIWVITFGLIACAGVIPLALIAGGVRGIPIPWRILDCSFGVFGAIPLYWVACHPGVERPDAWNLSFGNPLSRLDPDFAPNAGGRPGCIEPGGE